MSATPFAARLVAVMVAIVLAASALTVSLDYLKFRRILRSQEDQVYLFVGNELASTIEDGMNLGLPMAALQTTEQLIQRRLATEQGTVGISVFDSTGTVLFDTDQFRIGGKLPEGWRAPQPDAAEWRFDLAGANLIGARITNNFGQAAGGVVVRYDTQPLEARMDAILLRMVRTAVAMLGVSTVLAAFLLTRRHNAWFGRATAQINASAPNAAPYRGAPVAGLEAMMQAVAETTLALDEAEAALLKLGSGEMEERHAA
jgi:sensor histidine kinase regulating citrate/malate metabolism